MKLEPGSSWVDDTGRTLVVREVHPHDPFERHVRGQINGVDYACSFAIFDVIWAPRPVPTEVALGPIDLSCHLCHKPDQYAPNRTYRLHYPKPTDQTPCPTSLKPRPKK